MQSLEQTCSVDASSVAALQEKLTVAQSNTLKLQSQVDSLSNNHSEALANVSFPNSNSSNSVD